MSSPLLSFPPHMATILSEIPKLSANNWMEFKEAMEMLFLGSGASYLIDPKPSTTIPSQCLNLDQQLVPHIWARVEAEFRYIVQNSRTSALLAWTSLCSHFERSTMPRRLAARQQLYSVVHDPSKPLDIFIHSVTSAAKVLADLGYKVSDTEIKDLLLMKLDDSYASVRTSIMTSKEEPDLDTIKTLLSSASTSFSDSPLSGIAASASVMVASSTSRSKYRSFTPSSTPSFNAPGPPVQSLTSLPPDDKGYHWCNTSNQDACHRCGRSNHIAAFCIFTMPHYVKDWVMKGGYKIHNAARALAIDPTEDFVYESANGACGWIEELGDHQILHT
jgi:hypothetical protein